MVVRSYKRFFLGAYEADKPVVKLRNESLLVVLSSVLFGSAILAILIEKGPLTITLIAMFAMAGCFMLLIRSGKADIVNQATIAILSLLLASMTFLQPYREGSELYATASYEVVMLVIAGMVAVRAYQLMLIWGVGVVALTLDLFMRIRPAGDFGLNWINYIIGLFLLTIAAFGARTIMKRSAMLLGVAEREAERSSKQVEALESIIVSSKDALGIGATVRSSSERSADLVNNLKSGLDRISEDMARLSAKTTGIIESTSEVERSAGVVRDRVSDQSSVVAQSSSAIEEMTASVTSISDITVARGKGIDALRQATESGAREMERMSSAVDSVKASASSIAEVAKLIRAVASRTNLLAMNAAIEAAHAGASGLGFSVVAGEIRSLSEETARQVKSINESIKATLASIETAAGISVEAGASFGMMRSEAEKVASSMIEISEGLKEISMGTGEILHGVTESVSITSAVGDAAGTVDQKIRIAAADLEDLRAISSSVQDGLSGFIRLFDQMLDEARVMADAGATNESGLRRLAEVLDSLER